MMNNFLSNKFVLDAKADFSKKLIILDIDKYLKYI